ncbi:MAG: hypothetical protein Q9179_007694, partial [Wetmoreana sp. 5 TL-2023]
MLADLAGLASYWATDVVYNRTTGLWACCFGDRGTRNCNYPTDDTFQAPPPEELKTIASSTSDPGTSSPTSSASQLRTTTSSAAPSATPNSSSTPQTTHNPCAESGGCPSSLSSGAKAGIGVGATIAGLALIAMIFFMFRRRAHKGHGGSVKQAPSKDVSGEAANTGPPKELHGERQTELDSRMWVEMNGA